MFLCFSPCDRRVVFEFSFVGLMDIFCRPVSFIALATNNTVLILLHQARCQWCNQGIKKRSGVLSHLKATHPSKPSDWEAPDPKRKRTRRGRGARDGGEPTRPAPDGRRGVPGRGAPAEDLKKIEQDLITIARAI